MLHGFPGNGMGEGEKDRNSGFYWKDHSFMLMILKSFILLKRNDLIRNKGKKINIH